MAEAVSQRGIASPLKVSARLLRRRSRWVPPINLVHYPLCPADCVGNDAHRGRNTCSAVVLRELPSR